MVRWLAAVSPVLIVGALMCSAPAASRPTLQFGVRVPRERAGAPVIRRERRAYYRRTAAIGVCCAAAPATWTDRDDDRFWKAGLLYVNHDDPAIAVASRFGAGWTLNFGNRAAWLIIAGIAAALAGLVVIGAATGMRPAARPKIQPARQAASTQGRQNDAASSGPQFATRLLGEYNTNCCNTVNFRGMTANVACAGSRRRPGPRRLGPWGGR